MKTLNRSLLFAITALALTGTVFAQVPSTNDTSDLSHGNTGMGTGALGGPAPLNLTGGDRALLINTTGSFNTATGA
jgi:hypothetical protein